MISKAAIAARFTISVAVADMEAICTGFARPVSKGPTTVMPPSCWSILVEIEAEWAAGITNTLADAVNRQNG